MTSFTGQPCSLRCVTQPHPEFLSNLYSLALNGQLEQVRPVTSFIMRFLWLVGHDRTVFDRVLRYLMTQSQTYTTKNSEPDSNIAMYFRLRMREEERWIIMMNNSARQSCETFFHVITWHAAEELSKVGGQCQHASATPDRTHSFRNDLCTHCILPCKLKTFSHSCVLQTSESITATVKPRPPQTMKHSTEALMRFSLLKGRRCVLSQRKRRKEGGKGRGAGRVRKKPGTWEGE